MKKLLFLGLLLVCCNIYAQKQEIVIDTNYAMPKFEDKTAVLVDINAVNGKFSSFIRLTNYSKFPNLKFEVFVHSPLTSSWESLGNATLPSFEAEADMGKKFPNLSLYRYFAIVPKSDSKSEYQYKIEKKMGRLDVSIFTKGANMEEKPLPFHNTPFAYVFTNKQIPHSAKENIRLYNMTSQQSISATVFGWDKKTYRWIKLCSIAAQTGQQKATVCEITNKKLHYNKYKYLALATSDGKKYDYRFKEEHDDWTIFIEDAF